MAVNKLLVLYFSVSIVTTYGSHKVNYYRQQAVNEINVNHGKILNAGRRMPGRSLLGISSVENNRLENIDVKGLLQMLNKNGRTKTFANAAETKRLPFSAEKIGRESGNLKHENEVDSSKRLIEELTFLNTAYNKVSDRIKSVHAAIQKDFNVMMKLHILKGMMMEEKRSKDSEPLIKFLLKYKNHCQNNKHNKLL